MPSVRSFFRDPVAFVRENAGDRGVVRVGTGPSRFVLLRFPEAIWDVLVGSRGSYRLGKWKLRSRRFVGDALLGLDGTEHRRRRQLVQPALDRRRIEARAPSIAGRVDAVQAGWKDGARIHAQREMARLSLLVAGDVLLSADLGADAWKLVDELTALMVAIPKRGRPPAFANVDRRLSGLIAQRRDSTRDEGDLLGALLRSDLPDETIRGELLAFLLAAADEPPSALEAAWCLLALRPDAEERLLAELDTNLGERLPTLTNQGRLPYLVAVIRETLRLYPPVRLIDRCPTGDVRIDGTRIRAGSNVIVSPLVTHREEGLFERPAEFLPERWLSGRAGDLPKGAYIPFGAGAHACIGQPLALAIIWLYRRDHLPPLAAASGPRRRGAGSSSSASPLHARAARLILRELEWRWAPYALTCSPSSLAG